MCENSRLVFYKISIWNTTYTYYISTYIYQDTYLSIHPSSIQLTTYLFTFLHSSIHLPTYN